ncbi:diguanylate cyclase [Anopheles sinensis]|uniref:Diguanylate cyclase n=1 Tax=Anopheles sinensis TaxID=74873 RepID=A0A084W3S9_ANOSI|nr:diguanylate cyclase [Anopheles sinensis]
MLFLPRLQGGLKMGGCTPYPEPGAESGASKSEGPKEVARWRSLINATISTRRGWPVKQMMQDDPNETNPSMPMRTDGEACRPDASDITLDESPSETRANDRCKSIADGWLEELEVRFDRLETGLRSP